MICDAEHLFEIVAHEHHRRALIAKLPHDPEQGLALRRCQRRGRLVEQEETRLRVDAAHDLEHLLIGDGKPAREHVRGDRDSQARTELAKCPLHFRLGQQAAAREGLPEKDIGERGHGRDDGQLLVDRRYAEAVRVPGIAELVALAEHRHVAARRREAARDDSQEGRFAGAVLADERVYGRGLGPYFDALERDRCAEALVQVASLDRERAIARYAIARRCLARGSRGRQGVAARKILLNTRARSRPRYPR